MLLPWIQLKNIISFQKRFLRLYTWTKKINLDNHIPKMKAAGKRICTEMIYDMCTNMLTWTFFWSSETVRLSVLPSIKNSVAKQSSEPKSFANRLSWEPCSFQLRKYMLLWISPRRMKFLTCRIFSINSKFKSFQIHMKLECCISHRGREEDLSDKEKWTIFFFFN